MLKRVWILILSLFILSCHSESTVVLHDTEGHEVQLAQLHGKWLVINLWAAWCEACVKEIPALNQFYQESLGKDVVIYGASFEPKTAEELHQEKEKFHIQYPLLTENVMEALGFGEASILPTTFIINPQGKLAKTKLGANTAQSLKDLIETLKKEEKQS